MPDLRHMNIINLEDRRPQPAKQRNDISGSRYFCLACDTDRFKVMADGSIHCANCASRIRTIFAEVRE